MEGRRPLVAEIKRNSLDDGPGIRSVVFFKGCPLSCVWCHNPECAEAAQEIIFRQDACIGSRGCLAVCPEGAIGEAGPAGIDREKCTLCGECAEECPTGALSVIGRYYPVEELAELLLRDKPFYDNSGGGVTLSGGEPTLAMDYTAELARSLKRRGVQVLIETCGDFDWERFARKLLPHIDIVYVDMKLESEPSHERFAGRGNARIKANIERLLAEPSVEVLVRVPLIPEVTATRENLEAVADWLAQRGVGRIALMPYNPLWLAKARGLGRSLAYTRDSWMNEVEREAARAIFAGFEIEGGL
jgi:pyruvate formate lyase activating enzyme